MDQLGLIVLGAVFGAAATGGVQAWIAARERRLDRKVAARAILGDLFRTEGLLLGVLEYGQWPMAFDSQRPLDTWREFRGPFAAAVNGTEWLAIDGIFGELHQIALAATLGDQSAGPAEPLVRGLLRQLEGAQSIAASHAADSEAERREMMEVAKSRNGSVADHGGSA
jgi:hypothetical protein